MRFFCREEKWHKVFALKGKPEHITVLEEKLTEMVERQEALGTEVRDLKKLKSKLMANIVANMDGTYAENEGKISSKKLEEDKRLIDEINEKLAADDDELLDLPKQIDQANFRLMLATMDCCYDTMKENAEEIQEIAQWVSEIRVELKKKLIRKQEMEQRNHAIYSYMHDVFGAEVIDIFDLQYNPEEQHPS